MRLQTILILFGIFGACLGLLAPMGFPPHKLEVNQLSVFFQEHGFSSESTVERLGSVENLVVKEDVDQPGEQVLVVKLGQEPAYIKKQIAFHHSSDNFLSFSIHPNNLIVQKQVNFDNTLWVSQVGGKVEGKWLWLLNFGISASKFGSAPYSLWINGLSVPLKNEWTRITVGVRSKQWVAVWLDEDLAFVDVLSSSTADAIETLVLGSVTGTQAQGGVMFKNIQYLVPGHKVASRKRGVVPNTNVVNNGADQSSLPISKAIRYRATLTGSQVVPAITSSATGSLNLTYDAQTDSISFNLTWNNIVVTEFRGAFIYVGAPGETSTRPLITLVPFRSTSPGTGSGLVPETQAQRALLKSTLLTGQAYVQIETATNLLGEIRGEIRRVSIDPPTLTGLRPNYGFISGGKNVTVFGTNFVNTPELECQFGVFGSVKAVFISNTSIACVSPASGITKEAPVRVSNDGLSYSPNSYIFSYLIPVPKVTSLSPSSAGRAGGTLVTVFGSNFTTTPTTTPVCDFGGIRVVASQTSITGEYIVCRSPPVDKVGCIALKVSNDGSSFSSAITFTSLADVPQIPGPVINNIKPTQASLNGGTQITILGNFFASSPFLGCVFGGLGTTRATIVSRTGSAGVIVCSTPKISPPVQVPPTISLRITNDGKTYSQPIPFSFIVPVPTVLSVSPRTIYPMGGQTVTVTGRNFLGLNITCHFGDATSPAQLDGRSNYTSIKCISPAVALGNFSLGVSNDAVTQSPSSIFMQSVPLPVPAVTKVYPIQASANSQTEVTVLGSNFVVTPSFRCVFGTQNVPARFLYIGIDTAVVCSAPVSVVVGNVDFSVQNDINDATTKSLQNYQFQFFAPSPNLTSVSPDMVVMTGGTTLTFTGSLIYNVTGLLCSFTKVGSNESSILVGAVYVDASTVQCTTPKTPPGNFTVTLDLGNDVTSNPLSLVVLSAPIPTFESITPSSVTVFTSTLVTIVGTSFSTNTSIRFVNPDGSKFSLLPSRLVNSTLMYFVMPISNVAGTYTILFTNDGLYYGGAINVTYEVPAPTVNVSAIVATNLTTEGGQQITITGSGFYASSELSCIWTLPAAGSTTVDYTTPALYINTTAVVCTTPAVNVSGTGTLSILNSVSKVSEPITFTFSYPLPLIAAYSPKSAPLEGGLVVTMWAFRVALIQPQCRFGDLGTVNATVITVQGQKQFQCISPPSPTAVNFTISVSNDGVNFVNCCPFSIKPNFG